MTRYAYDVVDRLSGVTDPIGRVTSFQYDALSRRTGVFNTAIQAGALWAQAYTPDGLAASVTDAGGHSTTYAYDGFDRLGTMSWPDSSTEVLAYDADSNVLTRKTRKGDTLTLTYDTLNRPATKAAPSEATVTYAYDLDGRLAGASDTSAAVTALATSASYAASYTYDPLNRPITAVWTPAPAQTLPTAATVTFTHAYDATNRRIGQTASDNGWWSYPTTAQNISYTPNSLNQYSAVGSASPTYDGNGNLTFDGALTYGYDAESRLTSIAQGGTTVATYAYDAQGRRKSKTVGSTTTLYVTDADNREVLEYVGTGGALQAWYAFGPGPDAVLNRMNVAASSRQTMIPDIEGSIIGTLDSGGTLSKAGFQPYGENPTVTTGSFRYTGRRIDPETGGSASQPSGLYYYRARMYSPAWGRFLQPDPIGYAGGGNLYAYVGDDPLNGVDPSGLINNCYNVGNCPGGNPYGSIAAAQAAGQQSAKEFFTVMGAAVACIFACPEASAATLITTAAGAIGGGITGYNATGTTGGTVIGAASGATIGLGVGTFNPGLSAYVDGQTGNLVAGGATFATFNALGGAAVMSASSLLNDKTPGSGDLLLGAAVGGGSSLIEAPFVAAGGGAVLGYGGAGDAALSFQSAVFGTAGALATTCSVGGGCGPAGK